MKIDEQISELLFHYDCVIIPEFGGFVTNYKAASINERLHLFSPPSKEISFNKNLVRNDGLLANFLADTGKITFEDANAIIRKTVEDYFAKLNNGQRIAFNKVGIIYRDSSSNLQFEPVHEVNFLKDSFGLESVFAMPVEVPMQKVAEHEPQIIQLQPEIEQVENQKPAKQKSNRLVWAAVLMLPFVAYSGWLLTNADLSRPDNLTIADFNPFGKNIPAVYDARKTPLVLEPLEEPTSIFPENSESNVVRISFTDEAEEEGVWVRLREEEVKLPVAINTYVATPELIAMRYHVVGGCFAEEDNAYKLVEELRAKGYHAYILDKRKGLHRVTYGNFEKREDAVASLKKIQAEEMPGAWLLVK